MTRLISARLVITDLIFIPFLANSKKKCYGRTDGPTDTPSYRVASSRLKSVVQKCLNCKMCWVQRYNSTDVTANSFSFSASNSLSLRLSLFPFTVPADMYRTMRVLRACLTTGICRSSSSGACLGVGRLSCAPCLTPTPTSAAERRPGSFPGDRRKIFD